MKKERTKARIIVAGEEMTINEIRPHDFIIERNKGEHWFVCHNDGKEKYYIQENKEDGEITDICSVGTLCEALYKMAWL